MNRAPGPYGYPAATTLFVLEGNANVKNKGIFTAPHNGWYYISGCGGGSGCTSVTTGSPGAQIFRMPVFLLAGETLACSAGEWGDNTVDGGATVIGNLLTLGGGVFSSSVTPGTITIGTRLCSPVNIASGSGPGFSADLSTWPFVSSATVGSSGSRNCIGYGAASYYDGLGGRGLIIIEAAQ